MRWLAIDPGETVGWAVGWYTPGPSLHIGDWGQFPMDELDNVVGIVEEFGIEAAAIERFTQRGANVQSGHDVAKTVGGKIANILGELSVTVHWQTASDAKGVITDNRLKAMGVWIKGNPHARDAIRHLIIALRREGR